MIPRTAALLYWLLVVAGLAGVTILRFDDTRELVPLWLGTIAGVALGQLVARLRVRTWVLLAVAIGTVWIVAPVLFVLLYEAFGSATETCLLALFPAAVCGYLSLSERGGLVAFWYPAVLWMVVVLDGPSPGVFDGHAALPFAVGLAALFVAFLRARETRKVAIWRTHANARLATPRARAVVRASPLRAASQLAFTGLVGGAALVLTAWIAPHLWQKEQKKHVEPKPAYANFGPPTPGDLPCCPAMETKQERVREYLPLVHGYHVAPPAPSCQFCPAPAVADVETDDARGWTYRGTPGAGLSTAPDPWPRTFGYGYDTTPVPPYEPYEPTWVPSAPAPLPTTTTPSHVTPPPVHDAPAAAPIATATTAPVAAAAVAATPDVTPAPKPAPPPRDSGTPWESMLGVCIGAIVLHLVARASRRALTLRHLARPFWAETVDQRISNHWHRMLIGLRDAGIQPGRDEGPLAFARRVGIDHMETCATILERVRHGVRVGEADLDDMASAANAVYRAARTKAGPSARAVGWIRSPLA